MSSTAYSASDSPHEARRRRGSAVGGGGGGGGGHQRSSSSAASRDDLDKPNESWFLILVNAFKSNYERTLTYKEPDLYEWIMKAYPYYRHDMHTMQTSVKTTLHSYECFRQSGRGTWTFIPRRALIHLETLKAEGDRSRRDGSFDQDNDDEEEDEDDDEDEFMAGEGGVEEYSQRQDHGPVAFEGSGEYVGQGASMPFDMSKRFIPKRIPTDTRDELMAEDSPTLTAEEIERFKQEHQEAAARKLKRKASTSEHAGRPWPRPRSRSPVKALEDECHMSMEAWCNLLVQMFEASPKQKTIREIFSWVHDNYPIYREAPDESWKTDLTAALESNPLFRPMGRGRWQMASPDQHPPASAPAPATPGIGAVVSSDQVGVSTAITTSTATATTTAIIPTIHQPNATNHDGDATDSPSVTEDEDWKAIGSKRLLNFGFRRYSIATDTVPKKQLKPASSLSTSSTVVHGNQTRQGAHSSASIQSTTAAAMTTVTATTTGGPSPYGFLPHDQASLPYSGGRRYSSFHQPTPKNSPPMLPQGSQGLATVPEASLDAAASIMQALAAESDETDEDEELTKRYMAPLHNAINAAILANNYPSHPHFASTASTPATLHSSQFQQHLLERSSSVPRDPEVGDAKQDRRHSVTSHELSRFSSSHGFGGVTPLFATSSSFSQGVVVSAAATAVDSYLPQSPSHTQGEQHPSPVQNSSSPSAEQTQPPPPPPPPQQASTRPDPEIVIPNGESLAGDQMAALQALALLAGGG
ncbi:hypothetical protein DFQ27_005712 [Actinomortierella ambigua]|uniref:Fork-head domain-containing protein n=1 Tax=Actinomortierella ambigua TaxID=1343610 RepID=A0A9P6QIC6_9FUNG|nr:hypothetical protein DFQ27_005712 [Actinomortierella ambigua]